MRPADQSIRDEGESIASNREAFAAWAPCYDTLPNPLLTLEERYLKQLLPEISGRDVLDAGCGSGRWLRYCAERQPRTLKGMDASEEMLAVAHSKQTGAELIHGSCDQTPFANKSFDLIFLSFVLSYIKDLSKVAAELGRIAEDKCDLFLSDIQPETERRLGWKRSFASDGGKVRLQTEQHDLAEIVRIFAGAGWTLRAALAPEFGEPEREIFASSGRLHRFNEAMGSPAAYIFQFQKTPDGVLAMADNADTLDGTGVVYLYGGRCALGPDEVQPAAITIARGRIATLVNDRLRLPVVLEDSHRRIDLSGYCIFPGLINAHDHLDFSLFPRLRSRTYQNATEWAEDIHKRFSETISLHCSVPLGDRVWWGGIRNLLCGVTTVCHHNPWLPEFKSDDFPVRVIQRFGWEHSIEFGGDLDAAHAATPEDAPFIVHACEGVDVHSRGELEQLDHLGVLDNRSVLVHGLALEKDDAEVLRRRGVSVILCPSSNHFLFGEVPSDGFLNNFERVALGSDSPLTACGDLLDEVRFAGRYCALSPQRLYGMVTDAAAAILRLQDSEGSIKISARADLIAARDTGRSPAETLSALSASDVELVMRDGKVMLASDCIYGRLGEPDRQGLEPLCIGGLVRWLRAPVQRLVEQAEKTLGKSMVKLGEKTVWIPLEPQVDNQQSPDPVSFGRVCR